MVYVLLGTGFEETEAIAPIDLMRRANIPVLTVGLNGKNITGGHGITVKADITVKEIDLTQMEMIVLPGGLGGVASLLGCKEALDAITFAYENNKLIGAICAAPTILAKLGITDDKKATCYPGCEENMGKAQMVADVPCIRDGNIITGASAGCATAFGLMLVEAIQGEAVKNAIAKQIVIR
jgi:4-methyl-5(b-hydroxyethyl)-thiazole monophosphate biosynthesis